MVVDRVPSCGSSPNEFAEFRGRAIGGGCRGGGGMPRATRKVPLGTAHAAHFGDGGLGRR